MTVTLFWGINKLIWRRGGVIGKAVSVAMVGIGTSCGGLAHFQYGRGNGFHLTNMSFA